MAATPFILDQTIQDKIKAYIRGNIENGTAKQLGVQNSRLLERLSPISSSTRITAVDVFPENLEQILRERAEVTFRQIQNINDPRFFSQFNMESNIEYIRPEIEALFIEQVINQDGKLEGKLKPEYVAMLNELDPNGQIFQAREVNGKSFTREQWFTHCLVNSYLSCCKHYFGDLVARKVNPQTAPMSLVQNISLWQHPAPDAIQYVMERNPLPADASTSSTPILSRSQSAPVVGSSASSTATLTPSAFRRRSLNPSKSGTLSASTSASSQPSSTPTVGSSSSSTTIPQDSSLFQPGPSSISTPIAEAENGWPTVCQRMPAGKFKDSELNPGVMYIKYFATGGLLCSYIDTNGQRIDMRVSKDNVDNLSAEARAQLTQIENSEVDQSFSSNILLDELSAMIHSRIERRKITYGEELGMREYPKRNYRDRNSELDNSKDKVIEEKIYSSRTTKPPYGHNLGDDIRDKTVDTFIPSIQNNLSKAYITLGRAVTSARKLTRKEKGMIRDTRSRLEQGLLTAEEHLEQARNLARELARLRRGELTEKELLELIRLRCGKLTEKERTALREKVTNESKILQKNGMLTAQEYDRREELLQTRNRQLTEPELLELAALFGKMTAPDRSARKKLLDGELTRTDLLEQAADVLLKRAELLEQAADLSKQAEQFKREGLHDKAEPLKREAAELIKKAARIELKAETIALLGQAPAELLHDGKLKLTRQELLALEANLRIDAAADPIIDLEIDAEKEPIRVVQRELQASIKSELDAIQNILYKRFGRVMVLRPEFVAFQNALEKNNLSSLTYKELINIKKKLSLLRGIYININQNKQRSELGGEVLEHASFQSDIKKINELLRIVEMAIELQPEKPFLQSITSIFSSENKANDANKTLHRKEDTKWLLRTDAEWERDYEALDEKIINRWEEENGTLYSQYERIKKEKESAEKNRAQDTHPSQILVENPAVKVEAVASAPATQPSEDKAEDVSIAPTIQRSSSSSADTAWNRFYTAQLAEDQHEVSPTPGKKETEDPDSEPHPDLDLDSQIDFDLDPMPPLSAVPPLPVNPNAGRFLSGSSTSVLETPFNFLPAVRCKNESKTGPSSTASPQTVPDTQEGPR